MMTTRERDMAAARERNNYADSWEQTDEGDFADGCAHRDRQFVKFLHALIVAIERGEHVPDGRALVTRSSGNAPRSRKNRAK